MARGGLIDPSKFPVKSTDLDINSMQGAGESLGTAGSKMVTAMGDIETSWSKLPGVYEAPEGERVYALMGPAVTATGEVDGVFSKASWTIDTYVQALRGVKPDLEDLEKRAAAFRAEVEGGVEIRESQKVWNTSPHMTDAQRTEAINAKIKVNWWEDDATNQKNTALLAEYDQICAKILTASGECASELRGLLTLDGQRKLISMQQEAAQHPGPPVSNDQPAWGFPGDTNRSICESVSLGIINFGKNTINGIGGLFGFNLSHIGTGDLFRGEVAGQSWAGLGNLAGSLVVSSITPVQVVAASMKAGGNANGFTDWVDERNAVVRDTGAAVIGYDPYAKDGWHQWKEDPAAMATEMGLNVLTCLVPGAEVGAGLKAGSMGARAARFAGEAVEAVIPGGSRLLKGGLSIIRGADDAVQVGGASLGAGAARGGITQITIHTIDIDPPIHQPSIDGSIRPPHIDNPQITTRASSPDLHLPATVKPHGIDTPAVVSRAIESPAGAARGMDTPSASPRADTPGVARGADRPSSTPHGAEAPSSTPAGSKVPDTPGSWVTDEAISKLYDDTGPTIHEPAHVEREAGQPITRPHETPAVVDVPVREHELAAVGAQPGRVTNSIDTPTTRPGGAGGHADTLPARTGPGAGDPPHTTRGNGNASGGAGGAGGGRPGAGGHVDGGSRFGEEPGVLAGDGARHGGSDGVGHPDGDGAGHSASDGPPDGSGRAPDAINLTDPNNPPGGGMGWPDPARDYPRPEATRVVEVTGRDVPGPRTAFAKSEFARNLEPNTLYHVEGRGDFYTDARGEITYVEATYGREGPNWDLHDPKPNTTYVVHPVITYPRTGASYSHVFVTDVEGRTVLAHTDRLARGDGVRSESIQARIGNLAEGPDTYNGGHDFGTFTGGGQESLNVSTQMEIINQNYPNSFYRVEAEWRRLLPDTEGPLPEIEVNMRKTFQPGDPLPIQYVVRYRIDGGKWERIPLNNV